MLMIVQRPSYFATGPERRLYRRSNKILSPNRHRREGVIVQSTSSHHATYVLRRQESSDGHGTPATPQGLGPNIHRLRYRPEVPVRGDGRPEGPTVPEK